MALPSDAKTIYTFLTGHGYSSVAAAGIMGNMMQESGMNPESGTQSGNGGLIGWTPTTAAGPVQPIITGKASIDLTHQLTDVLSWAKGRADPSVMNKATTAAAAAALWMNTVEKPSDPQLANRQMYAQQVLAAAKSGNWPTGSATPASGGTGSGGSAITSDILGGIAGDLLNPFLASLGVSSLTDLFERAGLVIFGLILIIFGVIKLGSGGHGGSSRTSPVFSDDDSEQDTDDDSPVDDPAIERAYDRAEANGELLDYDEKPDRHTVRSHVQGRSQSAGPGKSVGRARSAGPGPKSIKAFGAEGPGLASETAAAGAGAGAATVPELAEVAVLA